jgi:hypothetical protein
MSKIPKIQDFIIEEYPEIRRILFISQAEKLEEVIKKYAELVRTETIKEAKNVCKKQAAATSDFFPLVYETTISELENSPILEIVTR